jgi:hypothetical protein
MGTWKVKGKRLGGQTRFSGPDGQAKLGQVAEGIQNFTNYVRKIDRNGG